MKQEQRGSGMNEQLTELKTLWAHILGDDCPDDGQFYLWAEKHTCEVIRHGLVKAAEKRRCMREPMETDHKLRYASSCMNRWDGRPTK